MALNSLESDKWKLIEPLLINIEQRGETDFIACLYEADIFGYGDSVPEALDELRIAISCQLEALLEASGKTPLTNRLSRQLTFLLRRIVKTPEANAFSK